MKVLTLELSTARGSVVVLENRELRFVREFANDRHNSAAFFDAVANARQSFAALDAIAVGLGPGSYAGTRIAISTAIGLQLAAGAKLLGVPSICALDVTEREYCVIGDARRKSFWIARVVDTVCIEMPELVTESELRSRIAASAYPVYSSEQLSGFENVKRAFPSATRLAGIAAGGHPSAIDAPLQPLYLREPHITTSKQPVWKATS